MASDSASSQMAAPWTFKPRANCTSSCMLCSSDHHRTVPSCSVAVHSPDEASQTAALLSAATAARAAATEMLSWPSREAEGPQTYPYPGMPICTFAAGTTPRTFCSMAFIHTGVATGPASPVGTCRSYVMTCTTSAARPSAPRSYSRLAGSAGSGGGTAMVMRLALGNAVRSWAIRATSAGWSAWETISKSMTMPSHCSDLTVSATCEANAALASGVLNAAWARSGENAPAPPLALTS